MAFFDKAISVGKSIGKTAGIVATNVGATTVTNTKEQAELLSLKSEMNVIDRELDASYAIVGKKYVMFLQKTKEIPQIDVQDTLKLIDPKIQRKQVIEEKIIELEKIIMEQNVLREKQQAEADFESEKIKLDRALAMGVLDQNDYEMKLSLLQKKLDNFEVMRKLEQQVEMGIITEEEKEAKFYEILN